MGLPKIPSAVINDSFGVSRIGKLIKDNIASKPLLAHLSQSFNTAHSAAKTAWYSPIQKSQAAAKNEKLQAEKVAALQAEAAANVRALPSRLSEVLVLTPSLKKKGRFYLSPCLVPSDTDETDGESEEELMIVDGNGLELMVSPRLGLFFLCLDY